MDKKLYMAVVAAFLVVGLASFGLYARSPVGKSDSSMGKNGVMTFDSSDLIGALVTNSKGNVVGLVNSLEVDSAGQAFAVLNHGPDSYYGDGGGYTPVPIAALRISEATSGQLKVVLNKTEKQLEAAPPWGPEQANKSQYEAKIDKYFGVRAEGNCS